jgi:hypothetical protein
MGVPVSIGRNPSWTTRAAADGPATAGSEAPLLAARGEAGSAPPHPAARITPQASIAPTPLRICRTLRASRLLPSADRLPRQGLRASRELGRNT